MQPANRYAFKEWAAICRAVAAGRQTILLRKGGIHEPRGRFSLDHDEFWLFPTRFHQDEKELTEEGHAFLAEARRNEPEPGVIRLSEYVIVTDVRPIDDPERLPALRPFHVYDDHVVADRFLYKRPGLMLLIVRAFIRSEPLLLPDSPHFAGCRSWVDLPSELSTHLLHPVLDEATFERQSAEIRAAATGTAIA
jgi:hypothetical protein